MIDVGRVSMIPIESIIVEDRYRTELGDLDSLEGSLKKSGLTTPLTVKDNCDGTYKLLAGGRRFTVLLVNGTSEVPVRIYDRDLSEIEMLMIEEAENIHRKDFEPHEHDALVARIHCLHQQTVGMAAPGPGNVGHKQSDTAEILGITQPAVAQALERDSYRKIFPELFEGCKTQQDATKVVKKIKETEIKRSIAEKVEQEKNSDSTLARLANAYINQDFFQGVKQIPDGVVHLVEIDPPYAIDLNKKKMTEGESKYTKTDYNEVDGKEYMRFINNVLQECYRVMTPNSWLICWFGPEPWFEDIYLRLIETGFNTTRMCGIWTKPSGQSMSPETRLANAYEMFFYAWKGTPVLNRMGRSNIFNIPPVPAQQKTHPTERPIELMKELYDTFAFPGSRILIPFLGSGNGILAAHELKMEALGFELSKGYRDSFLVKLNGMR